MAEPEGGAILDGKDFLMLGLSPSVNAAETGNTTISGAAQNNEELDDTPLPLQDASAPLDGRDGRDSLNNAEHAESSHDEPGKKKRGRTKGFRPTTKRKGTGFIDLTGVPPQPLILKNRLSHTLYKDGSRTHPTKAGSSKFTGVYHDASQSYAKWKAQIMVKGKVRSIGYYDNEEDAAADYARAAYKYKEKKAHSNVYGGLDLSGVPAALPLIRSETAASGFAGVKKNRRQRFEARIAVRKKHKNLGTFDTPEEAARIYARAKCFLESKPQEKKNHNAMPSASAEGPAADSSDGAGFIAESLGTQGATSGGNDGKFADDDPVGDVLDEDPVDASYMSDVDSSDVDGVGV